MATGFTTTGSDFDAQFIRREFFQEGQLWSWGNNQFGGLGDNTMVKKSSPVQTISGGLNWLRLSYGQANNKRCALKSDGTLWIWGASFYGSIGDGTVSDKSSPVQTISGGTNWSYISAIGLNSSGIKTDGTLWLWGYNANGQLGDNTTTDKSSPVQTVSGGNNWKQVSSGYSTAAIKTDGTLWMWGYNGHGQLGDNTIVNKSSPVQTVAAGTNWKQVDISARTYAAVGAIKTDGTLWMWGYNSYGQLGTNDMTNYSSPVQTIAGGTNWKQLAVGSYHSIAIKTDGTLWAWGQNYYGGLGDNTTGTVPNPKLNSKSSPVQTIAGGTNWKQVAAGDAYSAAIKTDGTLWNWGYNAQGQLGDNTIVSKSSPVQTIAGGTNWKQVSCGGNLTSGIYYIT